MGTSPREPRPPTRTDTARRSAQESRPWLRCQGLRPAGVDWPAGSGLDLSVGPGQLVAVTGPPGAGKSALLRTIAGIDLPERGEVYLGGHPAWSLPRAAARPGVVTPGLRPRPDFTVRENVALAPVLGGLPEAQVERRTGEALAAAGLVQVAQAQAASLSPVDRERLVLARELAAYPELLLLDDPYGALAPEARRDLAGAIAAIGDDLSTAVVYACAYRDEIADRAAVDVRLPPTGTGAAGAPTGDALPPFPQRLAKPGGQAPGLGMPLAIPLAGRMPAAPPARQIHQGPAWIAVEACWLPSGAEIARGAAWPDALRRARQAVLCLRLDAAPPSSGPPLVPAAAGSTFPPTVDLSVRPMARRRPARFRVGPGGSVARPELWSPGSRIAAIADLAAPGASVAAGQSMEDIHLLLAIWRGPQDDGGLRRLAHTVRTGGRSVLVPVVDAQAQFSSWGDVLAAAPYLYVLAAPRAAAPATAADAAAAGIWRALEPQNTVLALPVRRGGRPGAATLRAAPPELFGPAEQVLQVHAARRDALAALGRAAETIGDRPVPPAMLAAYWALLAGSFALAGSFLAGSGQEADQP